jgi:NADH-quinone oxidoreductase subunit K
MNLLAGFHVFDHVGLSNYLFLSVLLFCIGLFGVLYRRNAIILLMCIELMLNAVNLMFVTFSSYMGDSNGQLFVFFIMVVAAAEAAVGLAILVSIYRNTRTTDVSFLDNLKG